MEFNDRFVKSIGERVNVLAISRYLNLNNEERRGEGFKEYMIKNKIIKESFDIEKEGMSYYLKDYKEIEQKKINFRKDTKEERRYPNSPTGSVRSTYTTTTVIPEEYLSKINEIYDNLNSEKEKENKMRELEERNRELEDEVKRLKKKIKNYKENPDKFFDKLKRIYDEIVEIVIYTKPKKNKVKKHIANGKIY